MCCLVRLVTAACGPSGNVVVGSGRTPAGRDRAAAITAVWSATGGQVTDVVSWPEEAASWLRHARRFTASTPDVWIVAGPLPGWAGMCRRLYDSTDWNPARTFGFADLADVRLGVAAGWKRVAGMRGALADGGTWTASFSGLITRGPSSR
ncbi:hypothetical protein CIK06_02480 [Plantactinospora sp. KBS50]|nr:hypothetical protein CIK06_02480 [Plantactinospora sp. KBS50]